MCIFPRTAEFPGTNPLDALPGLSSLGPLGVLGDPHTPRPILCIQINITVELPRLPDIHHWHGREKNKLKILSFPVLVEDQWSLSTNYRQIAYHAQTPEKFWTNFWKRHLWQVESWTTKLYVSIFAYSKEIK